MARTPDRFPGARQEEELQLTDEGVDPSAVGALSQNSGALLGKDNIGVFNLRSGTGISEGSHRGLDQLVHEIAETSFDEFNYTGNQVDDIITWTTAGKTQKIREQIFTYSSNKISVIVTKQYDGVGVLIVGETLTETFAYSGSKVASITRVLT
jgi:hypothetical protein